jgi:ubiquinone/menaquinone biosynthesis C-methylase UbiE
MADGLMSQKLVCPWWLCFTFDNALRRFIHNPETILSPYVRVGQKVIDIGPGMGYFTIPLAKLVGPTGHVTAIDIQPKMLSHLMARARGSGVAERVTTYVAGPESLGNHEKADFILAFWMAHEVPDESKFLSQVLKLLNPGGLFLLVEPVLHVSKRRFRDTVETAMELGFAVKDSPRIRFSHSVVLTSK